MATQWQTFPIEFRGGLISNLSPLQHGTNAVGSATILQNFEPNKEGGYSKIRGYEKFSTEQVPGSGPILGLKVISSGTYVAARRNASGYTEYYYGTGTTWNSMGVSANTNGGKIRSVSFNFDGDQKVCFVDGTNYPAIYNPSGNTLGWADGQYYNTSNDIRTELQGVEHVAVFKDQLVFAKGNTLYYPGVATEDDFSSADAIYGSIVPVIEDITGLAVFREQLLIFTANTISRLTGPNMEGSNVTPITDRIGCISGDTIQEVGGDIMYLAPDGLRLLSATDRIGDFGLDVASDPIAKTVRTFIGTTNDYTAIVLRNKAQYRIFGYIASEQEETAGGLIATKFTSQGAGGISWAQTRGIKAYVADSTYVGNTEVAAFANADGYVYRMETGSSFDGSTISAIYESPYMPINDPQIRKTFYKMTLYAEPTGSMELDFNIKYDFGTTTNKAVIQPNTDSISSTGTSIFEFGAANAVFGTATYGGELDNVYQKNIIGSGKTIAIRIEDNSTKPTFTLDTALLEFRTNDRQ